MRTLLTVALAIVAGLSATLAHGGSEVLSPTCLPSPLPAAPVPPVITFDASRTSGETLRFQFWRQPCVSGFGSFPLIRATPLTVGPFLCAPFVVVQNAAQFEIDLEPTLGGFFCGDLFVPTTFILAPGFGPVYDEHQAFTLIYNDGISTPLQFAVPAAAPLPPSTTLAGAAVLPSSRSGQVGGPPLTAFASIIAAAGPTAFGCSIAPITNLNATFSYQTTNPNTNQPTGTKGQPVNVGGGALQTFVMSFTPTGTFSPTTVQLRFDCENTTAATVITGVNTILLSASISPVPDIVALVATTTGDGIVNLNGAFPNSVGAFAVATVNVGAGGQITASADTGSAVLPLVLTLCQTNPITGLCISGIGPTTTTTINPNETPTFAIFARATSAIAFDPAGKRIFVRFKDAGNVTRGSTSVAVRTQ